MRHVPVLLSEVLESLQLKPGINAIDCTLGDAGHAQKILEMTSPNGKLLGIDSDPEALIRAKNFLSQYSDRVNFVRDNFSNLKTIVENENFGSVQAILFDFGWSTPQFKERGRGFSFHENEFLDMRYSGISSGDSETAADLLDNLREEELAKIFKELGEEKLNKEIAEAIAETRKDKEIKYSGQLVEVILEVYRKKLKTDKEIPWIGGLHPATKVFQALRMAVNHELEVIERALPQAIEILEKGGRLAVISFHSLEDRIVKHYFKSQKGKTIEIITKKPIVCSKDEYRENPASRSAKLRVVEKL